MKRLGFAGALALLAAPVAAQSAKEAPPPEKSQADVMSGMAAMFKVEPLTAEQRARLPQAEALIAQIMPPGTLDQIMGGMFDKWLTPMMEMAGSPGSAQVARDLGIEDPDFEVTEDEAAQIAAIIDPAWKERRERETKAMQGAMKTAMRAMEPAMRKGMSEAYAVTFTATEMRDIAAFFATPSGTSFARKSYALASDPRIMAASMEGLPAMMLQMKAMVEEMKSATADLPPRRGYNDLTPAERATLARITGRPPGELRDGMARADAERAEGAKPDDET